MYKLKIKRYRILKNMTEKELAYKVGISQNYLSELENQKYDIKLSILFEIGKILNVCPKNLFTCNCRKCRKCKK